MLYFAVSLLIATAFCYVIFIIKVSMLKTQISDVTTSLNTVGTQEQKAQEKQVFDYIKKINDFNNIFKNHKFASNAFAFMQNETMPYIWFKQFALDQKAGSIQLSGQADNMDNFSRQVANFEKNKYVKKVGSLNSTVGADGKIIFSTNLTLDQKIFNYIADLSLSLLRKKAETPSPATPGTAPGAEAVKGQPKSNLKMITIFDFPSLIPQVIGQVDQNAHTISIEVPYGTNITGLAPSIIISPKATILPLSGVAKDFANPVVYKVTAEDGSVQEYRATIKILPQAKNNKSALLGILIFAGFIIVIIMAIIATIFYKRLRAKKQAEQQI